MSRVLCLLSVSLLAASATAGDLIESGTSVESVPQFGLADGPSWDGEETLYIPDVKGGKLFAFKPASQEWSILLPDAGRISATYFAHGQLYLADNGESGISVLQENRKQSLVSNDPQAKPPRRPNDLVVDAAGGVYYTLTAAREVMYVGAGEKQQVAISDIDSPNGIILSPDGRTLYVSAYAPKQIWAYDVTGDGKAENGRLFATMDDGDAKGADGMCIDSAGNVYCAGATDVWIWNSRGELQEKITTPERPINCTFGDADLKTLYITGFGGLWRQRMNVAGLPPVTGK